jgi:hypothetical protein
MAITGLTSQEAKTRTVTVDTDLSGKALHFVTYDTTDDNTVNLAVGATLPIVLLGQEATGSASDKVESTVILPNSSPQLVIAGAAVTPGAFVTANAAGRGIATTTAGDNYYGYAITAAAADGDYFVVQPQGGRY